MEFNKKGHCTIVRSSPQHSGTTQLLCKEGEILHTFNGHWTDEQVWQALAFANTAYAQGHLRGGAEKVQQMQQWVEGRGHAATS